MGCICVLWLPMGEMFLKTTPFMKINTCFFLYRLDRTRLFLKVCDFQNTIPYYPFLWIRRNSTPYINLPVRAIDGQVNSTCMTVTFPCWTKFDLFSEVRLKKKAFLQLSSLINHSYECINNYAPENYGLENIYNYTLKRFVRKSLIWPINFFKFSVTCKPLLLSFLVHILLLLDELWPQLWRHD